MILVVAEVFFDLLFVLGAGHFREVDGLLVALPDRIDFDDIPRNLLSLPSCRQPEVLRTPSPAADAVAVVMESGAAVALEPEPWRKEPPSWVQ